MNEIKSAEQLSLILGYIVPGLIIIYTRAQFLTGRIGPHKDGILSYFTLSIIYFAIVSGVTPLITGKESPLHEQTQYWLLINLVGAAVFGVIVGLNASFGLTRFFLLKLGLNLPHVLESAWDWRFSRFPPSLVTITLKDGSKVYGWCGEMSFFGSEPQQRDIYVEQIYDIDDAGNWSLKTPGKGIYISAGEIRFVEVIPRSAGAS